MILTILMILIGVTTFSIQARIIDLFKKEVKENSVTAILMLPPDDDAIDKRLQAECDWCQGFLSGFGIACGKDKVSSSIKEILEDVVEISQLQVTTEESEEPPPPGKLFYT